MNIAYVRTSTIEQHEDRQIEGLKKYGIDKWFIEKASGKNTDRTQLQEMLSYVREGDVVFIHDFSRLARSTKDLLDLVETFDKNGITLVSNKENVDTGTPTGKLVLTIIGAVNEFERTNLLERQREGIALAKEKGVYRGRKAIKIDEDIFTKHYNRYLNKELTKVKLAEILDVSRPTLDKLIEKHNKTKPNKKGETNGNC